MLHGVFHLALVGNVRGHVVSQTAALKALSPEHPTDEELRLAVEVESRA